MKNIQVTAHFNKWFSDLRDRKAKSLIQARIDRLEDGHYGDCKHIEAGINELRIFFGAGYRIYSQTSLFLHKAS